MMASLAEQLQKIKLKSVDKTNDVNDFSDPKLAGFTSEKDISNYQNAVLDVNTELWVDLLKAVTFPTKYCPITFKQAQLFITVYEQHFRDKDASEISSVDWRADLTPENHCEIETMQTSLQGVMDCFLLHGDKHVFVKTSSRSAKDAPIYQKKFQDLYRSELEQIPVEKRSVENEEITCLLTAAFKTLRMESAKDVLDIFMSSERIYQDMLLAVEQKARFQENFVLRKFVDIDVDMEFRGFVYNNNLTALSQYNYLIYSERLCTMREEVSNQILTFYNTDVKPRLQKGYFVCNSVIDFAICHDEKGTVQLWVIEINPFLETTDGALFSWQHERRLLEGGENGDQFTFRITERPKPGAKTMLLQSVRAIMNTENGGKS